ncbi:hypothetical protein BD779DRAFT_1669824 [Infundibulicybe gibba]|nr:hypothetical protein BD779DRAFT_1669824 [Infundibulicybe gibba]
MSSTDTSTNADSNDSARISTFTTPLPLSHIYDTETEHANAMFGTARSFIASAVMYLACWGRSEDTTPAALPVAPQSPSSQHAAETREIEAAPAPEVKHETVDVSVNQEEMVEGSTRLSEGKESETGQQSTQELEHALEFILGVISHLPLHSGETAYSRQQILDSLRSRIMTNSIHAREDIPQVIHEGQALAPQPIQFINPDGTWNAIAQVNTHTFNDIALPTLVGAETPVPAFTPPAATLPPPISHSFASPLALASAGVPHHYPIRPQVSLPSVSIFGPNLDGHFLPSLHTCVSRPIPTPFAPSDISSRTAFLNHRGLALRRTCAFYGKSHPEIFWNEDAWGRSPCSPPDAPLTTPTPASRSRGLMDPSPLSASAAAPPRATKRSRDEDIVEEEVTRPTQRVRRKSARLAGLNMESKRPRNGDAVDSDARRIQRMHRRRSTRLSGLSVV